VHPVLDSQLDSFLVSWLVPRLIPPGTSAIMDDDDDDDDECAAVGGMFSKGNRSSRRKLAPAPLCSPQIPHVTRAAAVGYQL
jgi:hypothetical protein